MMLNKRKARLEMVAFVVVAFAATGLTAAGTANYVALNLGLGTQLNLATLQSASSGMASLSAIALTLAVWVLLARPETVNAANATGLEQAAPASLMLSSAAAPTDRPTATTARIEQGLSPQYQPVPVNQFGRSCHS